MLVPQTDSVSYLNSSRAGFPRQQQCVAAEIDGTKLTGRDGNFIALGDDGAAFVMELYLRADGCAVWNEDCVTQALAASESNRVRDYKYIGH